MDMSTPCPPRCRRLSRRGTVRPRGVDGLVGCELALQAPRRGEDAKVTAVDVLLAVRDAGRRRTAFDDLVGPVTVHVRDGGGREVGVPLEPRKARQRRTV